MTVVIWNQSELALLLKSEKGAVARDLARRALNVESAAKLNASGRPGPNVRTGRLRASITHQIGTDAQGLFARIGSNVEYARYVEEGTPPRTKPIRPVRKKALHWPGARHPVMAVYNHPGSQARPYLRPALAAAAL